MAVAAATVGVAAMVMGWVLESLAILVLVAIGAPSSLMELVMVLLDSLLAPNLRVVVSVSWLAPVVMIWPVVDQKLYPFRIAPWPLSLSVLPIPTFPSILLPLFLSIPLFITLLVPFLIYLSKLSWPFPFQYFII